MGTGQRVCDGSNFPSILQAACFLVTALLHLFFMASFSWMLVEGLLLWSKVVAVNISEDRRMKLYYIIGWGTCFKIFLQFGLILGIFQYHYSFK